MTCSERGALISADIKFVPSEIARSHIVWAANLNIDCRGISCACRHELNAEWRLVEFSAAGSNLVWRDGSCADNGLASNDELYIASAIWTHHVENESLRLTLVLRVKNSAAMVGDWVISWKTLPVSFHGKT